MADIFSIARTSMQADMNRLNTVSHNLANIGTDGYKRQIFASSLQLIADTEAGASQTSPLIPSMQTNVLDLSQGVLKNTDNNHDIALNGNGFLVVDVNHQELLTRRGQLAVDGQGYLTLNTGERVLGEGGPISLDAREFEIRRNGELYQDGRLVDRLKRVQADSHTIEYLGAGLYRNTGELTTADDLEVMQGFSEGSNVESLAEMMELITTVRHYEASSQVLKSYDQVLDAAINDLANF